MSDFTWDIEKPEDKARFYWPREPVMEWWDRALEEGWAVLEEPPADHVFAVPTVNWSKSCWSLIS